MFLPLFPMRLLWLQVMLSALCLSELHSLALVLVFSVVLSTSADVKLLTSIKGRGQPIIPPVSLFLLFFEQEVLFLKKFIFVIPLIVVLVLNSLSITSFAEAAVEETYTGLPSYYYDKSELESGLNNQRHLQPEDYFFLKVCNTEWFSSDKFRSWYSSYYIFPQSSFSGESPDLEYSDNGGILTFTINNGSWSIFSGYSMCYYSTENPDYKDFRNKQMTADYESLSSGCRNLVYDSVNHTVSLSGGDTVNLTYGGIYYEILEVDYDINGFHYDPNALNINVSFSPNLQGSIDRSQTVNGATATLDTLNMHIDNNCAFGIQYYMAIVEKGYTPDSLYHISNLGAGESLTMQKDDNTKFIFLREENVYLNQVNTFKSLIVSPWHYLAASDSTNVSFKWSMFDLTAFHEYDVIVYGMRNDNDSVSTIADSIGNFIIPEEGNDVQGKGAHSVDFTTCQEVYRSTFSCVNPAVYDPNSSTSGAIANNSDFDYRGSTSLIKGYYDGNGNYHSVDYDLLKNGASYLGQDGLVPASQSPFYHDYSNSHYSYNSNSYRSTSYSSILSETSGVLLFFSSVLGFFPSPFITVFNLGLWSMLILLIIRRLH